MAISDKEILKQFVEDIVPELKAVSKGFANSIESEVSETGFEITASPFINVLIDGRGPTKQGAKKGSPTLQETLLSWINKNNIVPRPDSKGNIPTLEQLSWAMSQSIHMHGTLLYQRGGGNNIFDPIITKQRIDSLAALFTKKYVGEVASISKKFNS